MPKTKKSPAEKRLDELDDVVSALAHATRRQILLTIHFRGGAMTAGDIAGRFHCAWPTISRHLAVLESSGLVRHEKAGRVRTYTIDTAKLAIVKQWLDWFEEDDVGKKNEPR